MTEHVANWCAGCGELGHNDEAPHALPITPEQREVLDHYAAYNVPAQWFAGLATDHDGAREFVAIGDGFVWSFLIERDGTAHTSEARLGEFETGLTI